MNRRSVLLGISAAVLTPDTMVTAQALRKPLKIGILSAGGSSAEVNGADATNPSVKSLVQGLRDLGYRYGADFVIEGRGGEGRPDRYAALARELVAAKVDVLVAAGPTIEAARGATASIPIVMVGGATDPVVEKVVASLAAPGGNVTGLTLQQADLVGKRLELLKELVPGPAPIAVLWEDTSQGSWKAAQSAAEARGWQLLSHKVSSKAMIGSSCAAAKAAGARSLMVISGGLMFEHATAVVEAASANRLAAMYPLRTFPERGGLMAYAADLVDLYRRAASFVDRIAKGANPATMPIEQPTKFELVVNLGAARAIGVTLPPSLLVRADEVIK